MDYSLPPPTQDAELSATVDGPPRNTAGRRNEALLLTAAEEEFATYGLKGARVAAIAERAGLPKANLHYYFRTKQELYARVLADILETWLGAAQEISEDQPARHALEAYIRHKMDYSLTRPHASRVWASEIMAGGTTVAPMIRDRLVPWLARKQAAVDCWVARGELKPTSARDLFYMIWATTQHYADFATQICMIEGRTHLTQAEITRATDNLLNLLFNGLLTDQG
jgi:TetR/AcrR family transcriptional regulator